MGETHTLELTDEEHEKLRRLLDRASDRLREDTPSPEDVDLADACDHWLEIVEGI